MTSVNKCINCDAEIPKGVDYCAPCEDKELKGIRGFLLLPAIGIVVSVLSLAYSSMQTFNVLVEHYAVLHGTLLSMVIFEQIGFFLLLLLAIYTCVLFYGKKKRLPITYIVFLALGLVFHAIDLYATYQWISGKLDSQSAQTLYRAIVSCCIWIPYFLSSTRVKRTFVK